jgi:hypothetical protein
MKKLMLSMAAGMLALAGSAQANEIDTHELASQIALSQVSGVSPIANVINWKIGDSQDLNISLQSFPMGTMHKEAVSEEGNAIWLKQSMSGGMIGNQVVEVLLDRATGKVLKMKQNGQDKPVPDEKIEIIDQETATVTVPAGTFETIHIRARSSQGDIELWANPQAISLDGTAKMLVKAQGMPVSLELTKFSRR